MRRPAMIVLVISWVGMGRTELAEAQSMCPGGLNGVYFGAQFKGPPDATRVDARVDFPTGAQGTGNWQTSTTNPLTLGSTVIPAEHFSVRWTGKLIPTATGIHQFQVRTDDGAIFLLKLGDSVLAEFDRFFDQGATDHTTAGVSLAAGTEYDLKLDYYENHLNSEVRLRWKEPGATSFTAIPTSNLSTEGVPGLKGQYYNDEPLVGANGANAFVQPCTLTKLDPVVDFPTGGAKGDHWETLDSAPFLEIGVDHFSILWDGQYAPAVTGPHFFQTRSDDGVRLYVNGIKVIDNFTDHGSTDNTSAAIPLVAGVNVPIRLEYYENAGGAEIRLRHMPPGATSFAVIPSGQLYHDCSPPEARCQSKTVSTDPGVCTASSASIDNGSSDPDVGDTITLVQFPPGPYPKGSMDVVLAVTNNHNGCNACSATLTVVDGEAPSITCPGNVTVNAPAETCGSAVVGYASPAGTDNCPGATTVQTAGLPSGGAFPIGTTTNTFQASDTSGNATSCSFTVTVADSEDPTILCPENITVTTAPGTCGAQVTYAEPVGADNCSGSMTEQTAGMPSGAVFPTGTTTNTFRVTDASGRTATCSFGVTVVDDEGPTVSCPADIRFGTDAGTCGAKVSYATPMGTDNCLGSMTEQTDGLASGAVFPRGSTVNSFQVRDASGNTATCSFTVTVVDSEPPKIVCPLDQTVAAASCTEGGTFDDQPVATDNCPGVTTSCTQSAPLGPGTHAITCTASDGQSSSSCDYAATVVPAVASLIWHQPLVESGSSISTSPSPHTFTPGQSLVIQNHAISCSGEDETDAVEGEVVVRRLETVGTEVIAYEIDEVSANGESSGAMDHTGGHLRYVLDTDPEQYPAGTIDDPTKKFELRVVVKRLGIPVFSGTIDLESR